MIRQIGQRYFTEHPASVGETYAQHRRVALGFAVRLIGSGVACLLHAFVPGLCRTRGSDAIEGLYQDMVIRRR